LAWAEEDFEETGLDSGGFEGLFAHGGMGGEGFDDGVLVFSFSVAGGGELLFGVADRLLDEEVGFEEFALEDAVDVDELVVGGEVAFEEVVDLGDDLG